MAKLNIHDLAKELKREESEIISLCSSKGMSGVTRATMLQDTMVEEVRKAFKKPAEPADAAADKDGAPKKKLRLLFHPENSTKPISKKTFGPRTDSNVMGGFLAGCRFDFQGIDPGLCVSLGCHECDQAGPRTDI